MRFYPGPLTDPKAEKARAEAIESSERDRAEREAKHTPKRVTVPAGWKPYKKPSEIEAEIDREILRKMKKGII